MSGKLSSVESWGAGIVIVLTWDFFRFQWGVVVADFAVAVAVDVAASAAAWAQQVYFFDF